MSKKRKKGTSPAIMTAAVPQPWQRINHAALIKSHGKKAREGLPNPFALDQMHRPPPGVIPKDALGTSGMAFDGQVIQVNAWAAEQVYNNAYVNGTTFLGFTYLSELAQRPEYRRISEVLATASTKEWIRFGSTADERESKADKIQQLVDELDRLKVQDAFKTKCLHDGFFGRAHLYLDTGDTDDTKELVTPIGDGRGPATAAKFRGQRGFLKAVRPIEPVWCYPARYEASDPLKPDWYNPQTWFVQGKEIHKSRLLTSTSREVPDLLKPAYSFAGLSLSQMAKPYVDNWLRTRQAVADLVWSYSLRGLKTDMAAAMGADGEALFTRVAFFNNIQNNQGTMVLDKETEDLVQIVTPLAGLHELQAQAQEQMCSVTATPVVVLLGIQPSGLNASSEGEIKTWDSHVEAYQESFVRRDLTTVIDMIQLSLWGEVDSDITFTFAPLRSLGAKEQADMHLVQAQTDITYVEGQILTPEMILKRLAADPDSPYDGLDLEGPTFGYQDMADLDDGLGALERSPEDLAARRLERPGRDPEDGPRGAAPGRNRGDDSRSRGPRQREWEPAR